MQGQNISKRKEKMTNHQDKEIHTLKQVKHFCRQGGFISIFFFFFPCNLITSKSEKTKTKTE